MMKSKHYFQVSTLQLFVMAILMSVITSAIVIINNAIKEQSQLPLVTFSGDKCVSVANFKNGEAYTCNDVGIILRNYQIKK